VLREAETFQQVSGIVRRCVRGYFFPQTTPGKYKEGGPDIDDIEIVKVFERSGYQRIIVEPLDVSQTPPPADADWPKSRRRCSRSRPLLRTIGQHVANMLNAF
jgi:hypothetical protein